MIKTINLTGSEVKVTELGGDNTEIFNNGSGVIYASKLPNITVGGDEVIAIPAGAIDGLYGTHGTVYLLGSGCVELRGVDHKIANVRGATVINENGGVTEADVEKKCDAILDDAKSYADEKDDEMLETAKEYVNSLNAELAGYIGYTDNDIYGLEVDFENGVFKRLAGAVGKTASADFDSVNAYGGRRRCNLSDNGEVLAYYGDENFKADGSNGQVMVEQPKFYYRVVPLKTEKIDGADGYHLRKARYYISDTPRAGFKVHPAFVCNDIEVDKIYLSAFEGCIYDVSANTYLFNDEKIVDFDNGKLSSTADTKPCSGRNQLLTIANVRKIAQSRGTGWGLMTIKSLSATQLLFVIEYATFNSQSALGNGIISKQDGSPANTGATVSIGSESGSTGENLAISYRGEENLWGNISSFVDDLNIYNYGYGLVYISDLGLSENQNTGIIYSDTTGYISAFGYSPRFDWLFVPSETIGDSAIPVGDYFEQNKNGTFTSIAIHGGHFDNGCKSGLFCWRMHTSNSVRAHTVGCRLLYKGN